MALSSLLSLVQLHFTMTATFGLQSWRPLGKILNPHLWVLALRVVRKLRNVPKLKSKNNNEFPSNFQLLSSLYILSPLCSIFDKEFCIESQRIWKAHRLVPPQLFILVGADRGYNTDSHPSLVTLINTCKQLPRYNGTVMSTILLHSSGCTYVHLFFFRMCSC